MKKPFLPLIVGLSCLAVLTQPAGAVDGFVGAGSSAAAPVYKVWAEEYKKRGGEAIGYEPVGSGAGMKKIRQREVDFGASDVIASQADLDKEGLVMFPTIISGVVPVVNLPKISAPIRLTGDLLARIFLGEITHWNAPEIAALNPAENLPNLPIHVVCRSDSSGTTYNFSDYLSKESTAWKTRFGVANTFAWPASFIAVKGSSAVSQAMQNTVGAIGYIDYNYVAEEGLTGVALRNGDGKFVTASLASINSAVTHSRWMAGDFSGTLTGMAGPSSWPITMGTYVAIPKIASDTRRTARMLRFFVWSYANGDVLASRAKFIPLPDKVQAESYRQISAIVGRSGQPIGFNALNVLVYGAADTEH